MSEDSVAISLDTPPASPRNDTPGKGVQPSPTWIKPILHFPIDAQPSFNKLSPRNRSPRIVAQTKKTVPLTPPITRRHRFSFGSSNTPILSSITGVTKSTSHRYPPPNGSLIVIIEKWVMKSVADISGKAMVVLEIIGDGKKIERRTDFVVSKMSGLSRHTTWDAELVISENELGVFDDISDVEFKLSVEKEVKMRGVVSQPLLEIVHECKQKFGTVNKKEFLKNDKGELNEPLYFTVKLQPRYNVTIDDLCMSIKNDEYSVFIDNLFSFDPSQINEVGHENNTPLYLAAKYGRVDIIEDLLKIKNIEVNEVSKDVNSGSTPTHAANFYGHIECLLLLIKQCKNNFKQNLHGYYPYQEMPIKNRDDIKIIWKSVLPADVFKIAFQRQLVRYEADPTDEIETVEIEWLPLNNILNVNKGNTTLIKNIYSNPLSYEVEHDLEIIEKYTIESRIAFSKDFDIKLDARILFGVGPVAHLGFRASAKGEFSWKDVSLTREEQIIKHSSTLIVPPFTDVECIVTLVAQETLSPFKAKLYRKRGDFIVEEGNLCCTNLSFRVEQVKLHNFDPLVQMLQTLSPAGLEKAKTILKSTKNENITV